VSEKKTFTKPAISPKQHVQRWRDRGLPLNDDEARAALQLLTFVSAYRLKGYWLPLVDPATERFRSWVRLEHIVRRYQLDQDAKRILSNAMGPLEVAVRTVISDTLSARHSPHWFLKAEVLRPTQDHSLGMILRKIEEEVERARERPFVAHYRKQYNEPYLPPSWAISECVSFGLWSRIYKVLRAPEDRMAICKVFKIDQPEVFESWLHACTVARNIAAHNDRFFGVKLSVAPSNYKRIGLKFTDQKSYFAIATVMHILLQPTGQAVTWRQAVETLDQSYSAEELRGLGFPQDWRRHPGW
jgi:abortive infection bacteriophage resistance protein